MISFKPLYHTLLDRGIAPTVFGRSIGLSTSTLSRIKNGRNVTLETVETICSALRCSISDVVEITLDDAGSGTNDKGGGGM